MTSCSVYHRWSQSRRWDFVIVIPEKKFRHKLCDITQQEEEGREDSALGSALVPLLQPQLKAAPGQAPYRGNFPVSR